jgi:molybdate transport system ATP-binding protein
MIRFDLEVQRGDFRVRGRFEADARVGAFHGPTGSGKTTLLLALAGLCAPRKGRIELDGEVLFDETKRVSLPPERRRIGVVFQESRLFPHLDVRGNLRFAHPHPGSSGPRFEEVVDLFDLETLLHRAVQELSGGQARLVAIARALLARPRLLLLDEPLTGLDPALRRRVLAYLLRLKDSLQMRLLLVSHRYSDILALADLVAPVEAGALREAAHPAELLGRALSGTDAEDLETTLLGKVEGVGDDLATVVSEGTRFLVHLPGAAAGDPALLTVRAEDALLAVDHPPRTSARNVLAGRVVRMEETEGRILVGIEAGPLLWAEVTPSAARELGLEPGRDVYVLLKTSALRACTLGNTPRRGLDTTPSLG